MRSRKRGQVRQKLSIFLKPELQYIIEQSAKAAGYIRTTGSLAGRADYNAYIEDKLTILFNLQNYNPSDLQKMADYQIHLNQQRKKN